MHFVFNNPNLAQTLNFWRNSTVAPFRKYATLLQSVQDQSIRQDKKYTLSSTNRKYVSELLMIESCDEPNLISEYIEECAARVANVKCTVYPLDQPSIEQVLVQ